MCFLSYPLSLHHCTLWLFTYLYLSCQVLIAIILLFDKPPQNSLNKNYMLLFAHESLSWWFKTEVLPSSAGLILCLIWVDQLSAGIICFCFICFSYSHRRLNPIYCHCGRKRGKNESKKVQILFLSLSWVTSAERPFIKASHITKLKITVHINILSFQWEKFRSHGKAYLYG